MRTLKETLEKLKSDSKVSYKRRSSSIKTSCTKGKERSKSPRDLKFVPNIGLRLRHS